MRKSIQTKSPSSQIGRPELETSNQKKSTLFRSQSLSNEDTEDLGGNDNHYTMYSQKIFRGSKYMPKFIKPCENDQTMCYCLKCKDSKNGAIGKKILVNSVYSHIKSKKHRQNTPKKEHQELDKLIQQFEAFEGRKNLTNSAKKSEENKEDLEHYLKFIGFLMSQNLSYSQIQNLGDYLKDLAKEKQLRFLKKFSFEEQLLSKISKDCFRPYLIEELKEKLATVPYTLIVDNATFSNQNFCALKVKFLDTEFHQEINSDVTTIRNRVIGLATLKECSSGRTMKKIIDDKLFTSEDLKNNMKGFTHDNGSQLVGSNIGVASLLKNSGNEFYDLNDPCHGLNLTIKKSVQILPKELINFVRSITNYFISPQKRAALKRIQEQKKLPILFPVKLGATRWLSLGQSFTRLLDIWESLYEHFKEITEKKQEKKLRKYNKKTKNQKKMNFSPLNY